VRIVLIGTNVWVSALINSNGYPARLVRQWTNKVFQVVVSKSLLEELEDVFSRPRVRNRYNVNPEEIEEILRSLADDAIVVATTGQLQICRDPDDDLILETALLGGAEYAVSRDDDIKSDRELVE
jgi:uncharacterized protein